MPFSDRTEAGRLLAERLEHLRTEDVVVLGVAPGGIPVAAEVARVLDAPLDVLVVRDLPRPFQPSLAMGAVAEDGALVVDDALVGGLHIGLDHLAAAEAGHRPGLERQASALRGGRDPLPLRGRTAIVVCDGIVTGLSARAAVRVARGRGAARVALATPVCAAPATVRCRREADEVAWLLCPPGTPALADHYRELPDLDDAAMAAQLRDAHPRPGTAAEALPTG